MTMKNKSINIYVVIAFLSLAYPMLVGLMNNNNVPNLVGIVINPINPDSLLKKDKNMWFSGEYQTLKDDYNNDHWEYQVLFRD
jgi:hypothetical protein